MRRQIKKGTNNDRYASHLATLIGQVTSDSNPTTVSISEISALMMRLYLAIIRQQIPTNGL
ncbi:hypothetical protein EJA72_07985 [Pseudomonas sp. PB120]|uniref:hypothetical protein n=1 Tax=Pseudomonas sp. PB120 TaxID=2494700 RepID=UPI0012FE0D0E|nr:hypothetical protein [Pseudomonas sp. PB120]MVV48182.1 hypothetical protein [Pseudomonas sp. PB120]